MAEKDVRLLDIVVATYDNVRDAEADLEALRALYETLGTSHNFDAAVLTKTEKGKVKISKTYEAGRRHDALKGLGWGLAAGLIAAIFPAVGIGAALLAGGIGGAAIGALVGHIQTGVPRDELKKLGDVLESSQAALVAVYETSLADQIAKNLKAVNRVVSKVADLKADQIAEELRQRRAA